MKKTIGLAVLMLTAVAAFAQPAAASERFNGKKEVIVVKHENRRRAHKTVRVVRRGRTVRYEAKHR